MKLKVNDAGLPIKSSPSSISPKRKSVPSSQSSSSQDESCDVNRLTKGITVLWSLLTLFLNTALILVAISLTLCDIVDLEADAQLKLISLPQKINHSLTDWAPRFLVTIIGFMLSVIILVLEKNDNCQPWDAVICLLWFTSQIFHLPEASIYFSLSELFIFNLILSASLALLSLTVLIFHLIVFLKPTKYSHEPRDVRSINPSHKELVKSFRENNEILSSPSSKSSSSSTHHETTISADDRSNSPSPPSKSSYKNLIIKPDSALRKRLADLSIDKANKIKHCSSEDEPFDKLLEKLGANLQKTRQDNLQGVTQQTNWFTSAFCSTRCYGDEREDSFKSGMFASFTASWSKFIPNNLNSDSAKEVVQISEQISSHGNQSKSKRRMFYGLEDTELKAVVKPSKLNILPQLAFK